MHMHCHHPFDESILFLSQYFPTDPNRLAAQYSFHFPQMVEIVALNQLIGELCKG